ncbi:hypothetical protein PchlO6_6056 [Pseudomonas chlororaphis O6]|uniref:Uncharacterized protein n=1 Tax=Pseudomonas chlororaphis O6 TaxID=1037915 RepID=A0AB33WVT6_9PSED|nr:hypothetical protein PchlO6_6056 [Pseudomonas chlororaphis O6]
MSTWVISATFAAVTTTRCTKPDSSPAPISALAPKVVLVTLLGLVHFLVARVVFILGQAGCIRWRPDAETGQVDKPLVRVMLDVSLNQLIGNMPPSSALDESCNARIDERLV